MSSSVGIFCSNNRPVQGNRSASPRLRRPWHQYPTFMKLPMERIEDILFLMIHLDHFRQICLKHGENDTFLEGPETNMNGLYQ